MKCKYFKSKVFLLLAVAFFFVAGCKNDNKSNNNETVKIGAVLSLSGKGAKTGEYTLNGIKLAIDEQNEKGGLLGKTIVLEIEDSKGEPKTGVSIIKKMFRSKTKPFVVCSNMSGVSLAIKPETESNKSILIGSAATDKLTENSKYVLRSYVESGIITERIMEYLSNDLRIANLGVFYINNEYGSSVSARIKETAETKDISLSFIKSYNGDLLDFKSIIASTPTDNVQAIYFVGYGKGLGSLIKQVKEAGYQGNLIGDPLFNNPDVLTAAGKYSSDVKYLDFAFDVHSTNPKTLDFIKNYRKEFGQEPENLAAITYDALQLFFKGVSHSQKLNSDEVMKNLQSLTYEGSNGEISLLQGNIIYPTRIVEH